MTEEIIEQQIEKEEVKKPKKKYVNIANKKTSEQVVTPVKQYAIICPDCNFLICHSAFKEIPKEIKLNISINNFISIKNVCTKCPKCQTDTISISTESNLYKKITEKMKIKKITNEEKEDLTYGY